MNIRDLSQSIPSKPLPDKLSHDPVKKPLHYMGSNGIEVIDVIDGFGLNYHRGNVCKYLLRAGRKDNELEDLKKAATYLQREIDNLSKS